MRPAKCDKPEAPVFHLLITGIKWPPETFLQRLIAGLLGAGVEITVACANKPETDWLNLPLFHWLDTPSWNGSVTRRIFRMAKMATGAAIRSPERVKLLSQDKVQSSDWKGRISRWYRLLPFAGNSWDIVYFPWNSGAITYLSLFNLGVPVVVSCRGSQVNVAPHDPSRGELRSGLPTTFSKAAAVHCVSESIKAEALTYGLDPEKAWIIRQGIDPDFFKPSMKSEKSSEIFNIISVGSLFWIKGYEYGLVAIRRLLNEGHRFRFDIIGEGPDRQRILYTISDLGLKNHVFLCGQLRPETIRDKLQQADVFLLSSLSEGVSNAALEAMSCGLPVVATNCGGMGEAITNGVEGYLVPVRDTEKMGVSLKAIFENPEVGRKMGAAGREKVLREFTLDKHVRNFLEMFEATYQRGSCSRVKKSA